MRYVLLSFNLSMLTVAQALISPKHICIDGSNLDILSGPDTCSCKSSIVKSNKRINILLDFNTVGRMTFHIFMAFHIII